MTLKHGQGHQTWYALVDPKQGYNPAKFARPHFNSEKISTQFFCQGYMSIISLEYMSF